VAQEEEDPSFAHHAAEALPVIEDGGMTARLIAGQAFGARSPLETASETLYADVQLAPGASFTIEPSVTERALYTISGDVEVAGQTFSPAQLLVLRPGDHIAVHAVNTARVTLFGGEPMEGPRWIWWNFVSSRKERIEQAQEEWRRGRFDTVPGDEAEFIPLPETNTKPWRALGGVFYPQVARTRHNPALRRIGPASPISLRIAIAARRDRTSTEAIISALDVIILGAVGLSFIVTRPCFPNRQSGVLHTAP